VIKAFVAPGRYIQGPGLLQDIGKYVAPLGSRALVVWGPTGSRLFAEPVEHSMKEYDIELISFVFAGECNRSQVELGGEKARASSAQVVVGLGGGKAMDLAKAVAMEVDARLVTVPTIASTDAPTSAITVYYSPDGRIEDADIWPRSPNLVLVDTQVIVQAPVRWFVSGIGDGLATWFEAAAAYKERCEALSGGVATQAALALARLCHETLIEYGIDAVRDCAQHIVTPAVERVVEASTLLSGLGFESAGLATAHTIGHGLTLFDQAKAYSHGEKVAFGLATQLCLDEDIRPGERLDVFDFLVAIGLPVTLEELGLGGISTEALMEFAKAMCAAEEFTHNHVFAVTPFDLYSAMVAADRLGHSRRALTGKQGPKSPNLCTCQSDQEVNYA
jgi:glycerol dehydrogenase